MRIVIVNAVLLIAHVARRDIDLAADNRLYARSLAGMVEIDSTVHYAVIGDRDSVLPQLLYTLRQLFDAAGAVEQGILAMHMKMNERHIFYSFSGLKPIIFLKRWLRQLFVTGG